MNQEQAVNIIGAIMAGWDGLELYISEIDFEMLMIWTIVATIDVIVGVITACRFGEYQSKLNAKGLIGKVLEFLLLTAVIFAQRAAQKLGYNLPAKIVVLGAFIIKDIGSIMESLIETGMPLPKKMKEWFAVASKRVNNLEEDEK